MKKNILIAVMLSVVMCTLMMWCYPAIEKALLGLYLSFLKKSIQFIVTTPTERYEHMIRTSLSFGAIPLMSLLALFLIQKFKNKAVDFRMFVNYTLILLLAYVLGFIVKFVYLLIGFMIIDRFPMPADILNNIPLNQVNFYSYSIWLTCITLLVLVTKHKKESKKHEVE